MRADEKPNQMNIFLPPAEDVEMTNPQKLGPLKTTAGGKTSTFKTSTTNRALCCHGYLNCCNLDLFSCAAHIGALGPVCSSSVSPTVA